MEYIKNTLVVVGLSLAISGTLCAMNPQEQQIAADEAYAASLQEAEAINAITEGAIHQLLATNGPETFQHGATIMVGHGHQGHPQLIIAIGPHAGLLQHGPMADQATIDEALRTTIPELSGTPEESRDFISTIKMSLGIDESKQPRTISLANLNNQCPICTNTFASKDVGIGSTRSTNCCHQLICQQDVEQIEQTACNLYMKTQNPNFRAIYSQSSEFSGWDKIKQLGTCPFCRHYPLLTSPVIISEESQK